MIEYSSIKKEELKKLNTTIQELELDISYLRLVYRLMHKISTTSSLTECVESIVKSLLGVTDGDHVTLTYLLDGVFFSVDSRGECSNATQLDNASMQLLFHAPQNISSYNDANDTYTWYFPIVLYEKTIGVCSIENIRVTIEELFDYLPLFFNYTALILGNEISGYAKLQASNRRLKDEVEIRKKVEQELLHAKENLEAQVIEQTKEINQFFDVALDLLCIANLDGDFIRLNRAWEETLGYKTDELMGKKFLDFIHPEDIKATLNAVSDLSQQKSIINFVNRYRCKDGSYRYFEWRSTPSGKLIYAAARDITARIETEKELTRHKENLEGLVKERTAELESANDKLKELDQLKSMFIASMSHELRTPLNSIIGFSDVVLRGLVGEVNEKQRDYINRVHSSGKHLLSLISDVIDISKIEAGHAEMIPEHFEVSAVVQEVSEEIEILLQNKGLTLTTDIENNLAVTTDKRRLHQCLLNFCSNAIKFTDTGNIHVKAFSKNGDLAIEVNDTGIGISKEDQKKLFVAFERFESHLKVQAGGTGLGLYLTKKIVEELLGGSVYVTSQLNAGSTFGLNIPKRREQIS